jgi:hypothetical protein
MLEDLKMVLWRDRADFCGMMVNIIRESLRREKCGGKVF